jgi:hypothetical protein
LKTRFIGDIHGDFKFYQQAIRGVERSVQVGDFGLGFAGYKDPEPWNTNHRFIRGNHDNPAACKKYPNWIPDGTFENGILYIGGAASIDREHRIIGRDWWPDEEVSLRCFTEIHHIATEVWHPHTLVTHDCPYSVVPKLFPRALPFSSQTQNCLDYFLEDNKSIKTWIFGHWHENVDTVIDGVRYICLGINQYKDIEL